MEQETQQPQPIRLNERWRQYTFSNGQTIRVENAAALLPLQDGSHQVFESNGVHHVVRTGWTHLAYLPFDPNQEQTDGEPEVQEVSNDTAA